jgi:hypothetical protein
MGRLETKAIEEMNINFSASVPCPTHQRDCRSTVCAGNPFLGSREKQKIIFNYIEKMRSSLKNKYCLYCRTEMIEKNHHCKELETTGDVIAKVYFELNDDLKKEIIFALNDLWFKNIEFVENIKNKILAYSL